MDDYLNFLLKDDIDKWLYENFNIMPGCCSAQKSFEYNVARAVAEKLWNNQKSE